LSVVEHQDPLEQEEGEEAQRDQRHRVVRLADALDRLRQDLEQRHGNDDATAEGDHGRQRVGEAQSDRAASEDRQDRQPRKGYRYLRHAAPEQAAQVPRRTTSWAATENRERRPTAAIAFSRASPPISTRCTRCRLSSCSRVR
jgi:hypothetical protein